MLTTAQRERIVCHLQRGWKLPDSLIHELWEAYEALEQAQTQPSSRTEATGQSRQQPAHSVTAEQHRN